MPRFRLIDLFALLTSIALVIVIVKNCGILCAFWSTLLVLLFLAGMRMPAWLGAALMLLATMFAALPWLGLGYGSFVLPHTGTLLPSLELKDDTKSALMPVYWIGSMPVEVLALIGPDAVWFTGSGRVRPYIFFLFWTSLACCFSAAILTQFVKKRRKRFRCT